MNIQQIASKARNSISNYCINECHAYCCRKGYLILNEEELNLLTQDKRKELEDREFIKQQEGNKFSLNFSNHLGSCPQLNDSKCMIHKNPKRPLTCEKFPIFVDEEKKEIRLSPRCFAVKENKLFPYTHKFLELGFKVNEDYF
ncbi:YkgJ family cysteine cluster protein [Candidatus Woesearchaeota archaeon]|nr:YkgJ family cysteine cluster protein [Candidatus Woesearchaeota archaeon]